MLSFSPWLLRRPLNAPASDQANTSARSRRVPTTKRTCIVLGLGDKPANKGARFVGIPNRFVLAPLVVSILFPPSNVWRRQREGPRCEFGLNVPILTAACLDLDSDPPKLTFNYLNNSYLPVVTNHPDNYYLPADLFILPERLITFRAIS